MQRSVLDHQNLTKVQIMRSRMIEQIIKLKALLGLRESHGTNKKRQNHLNLDLIEIMRLRRKHSLISSQVIRKLV